MGSTCQKHRLDPRQEGWKGGDLSVSCSETQHLLIALPLSVPDRRSTPADLDAGYRVWPSSGFHNACRPGRM